MIIFEKEFQISFRKEGSNLDLSKGKQLFLEINLGPQMIKSLFNIISCRPSSVQDAVIV